MLPSDFLQTFPSPSWTIPKLRRVQNISNHHSAPFELIDIISFNSNIRRQVAVPRTCLCQGGANKKPNSALLRGFVLAHGDKMTAMQEKKNLWPDIMDHGQTSFSALSFLSSCAHDKDGSPYLCPDSWAIVKARPRPVSSLTVQLRYLLHIPLIGAKPAEPVISFHKCYITLIIIHYSINDNFSRSNINGN